MIDATIVNVQTGEVSSNTDSRLISYQLSVSCDACLDDGYGTAVSYTGDFNFPTPSAALAGFIAGRCVLL